MVVSPGLGTWWVRELIGRVVIVGCATAASLPGTPMFTDMAGGAEGAETMAGRDGDTEGAERLGTPEGTAGAGIAGATGAAMGALTGMEEEGSAAGDCGLGTSTFPFFSPYLEPS